MPSLIRRLAGHPASGLVAVLLLGFVVYLPGLHGGYVFDDFPNLLDNPAFSPAALRLHFWAAVWSGQAGPLDRPLSSLSFALQMAGTGFAPLPLKLGNVLLHLANGALVWALVRRVLRWCEGGRRGPLGTEAQALLVTALWVLAPIQLTAVLYVVQREESLAALFVLAGLLGYWRGRMLLIEGRPGAWAWIWVSLLLGTVLGSLAKETGALLPAYAAVLEWTVLRLRAPAGSRGDLATLYVVVLAVPAALGLAWVLPGVIDGSSYGGRAFTASERLLTEGRVMVDYLRAILLPDPGRLSLYHDDYGLSRGLMDPPSTLACWAALMVMGGLALAARRRWPLLAFGVLWFFCGQSLVSTVIPLDLVYDHRNYLPSLGIDIAAVGCLGSWASKRALKRHLSRLLVGGLACVVLLNAGITALRAQTWGQPLRLAAFEAALHPRSPRAVYDLARILLITSDGPDDPSYQHGMELAARAAALPGASLQPLQAMVFMSAKNARPVDPAWWEQMRASVAARDPGADDVAALYSLVMCDIDGVCHDAPADIQGLSAVLDAAVRRSPTRADIITLRANFEANVSHRTQLAYLDMLRAVALDPGNMSYWDNLATIQVAAGLRGPAAASIARMRELDRFGLRGARIDALQRQLAATPGRAS